MKAKHLLYLSALIFVLPLQSCFINEDKHIANDAKGNFEMLWKICDENYCYFDYKNVDWDSIYTVYEPRVYNGMSDDELFQVCADMLAELKDGHVNLLYDFDLGRSWSFMEEYPENYSERVVHENYLNFDYYRKNGFVYQVLPENIGYMHYSDFTEQFSENLLDHILYMFKDCKGIIFDIRNNGGGSVSNVNKLACRFTKEPKVLKGYKLHKTGKGHNDFGDTITQYLTPPSDFMSFASSSYDSDSASIDSQRVRFLKPVVVLTNRAVYSAANDFVRTMKVLDNATIIGDRSGGGGGIPISFDLPNGWAVRLSATPMLDSDKKHTEMGIDPDIKVDMAPDAEMTGRDAILDKAIEHLLAR